jgi:hypothetical protein
LNVHQVKFDGNNYHLAVCIWLSKVYSNSIMVVSNSLLDLAHNTSYHVHDQILNSRAYIGHEVPPNASRAHMSDMVFQSIGPGPASAVHVSMGMGTSHSSIDLSTDAHSDSSHDHQLRLDKQRGQIAV